MLVLGMWLVTTSWQFFLSQKAEFRRQQAALTKYMTDYFYVQMIRLLGEETWMHGLE